MKHFYGWLSVLVVLGVFISSDLGVQAKSASGGGDKVSEEALEQAAAEEAARKAAEAEAARQAELAAQAEAERQAAVAAAQQAAAAEAERQAAAAEADRQAELAAEAEKERQAAIAAAAKAAQAEQDRQDAAEEAVRETAAAAAARELAEAQAAKAAEEEEVAEEEEAEVLVENEEEAVVCAHLEGLKARIQCRIDKDETDMYLELSPENYMPEGCRWGNEQWQENCKKRYKVIHYHYELPLGAPRMEAIKDELGLAPQLKPMSQQCEAADTACQNTYRTSVEHLIVARFYDLEERAEELYELGKASESDLVNLVAAVSEAKINFYEASKSSNPTAEQREIITNLRDVWNAFTDTIN